MIFIGFFLLMQLSINFPPVAYLNDQNSQNLLLYSIDDAVIAYSHTVQAVAVLELFNSRRQGIVSQSEDAGIQAFQHWFGDSR